MTRFLRRARGDAWIKSMPAFVALVIGQALFSAAVSHGGGEAPVKRQALVDTADSNYTENIGKTPPMGWNSWNCFRTGVSSQKVREIADAAARLNLDEAGYTYLVIDDGWQSFKLDADGSLLPMKGKFPEGIPALVEDVNERGFELGLYSSPNVRACANRAGSLGYEERHASQFAQWGCKFVKYDTCPTRNRERDLAPSKFIERCRVFGKALHKADPEIVYALCDKGWGGGVSPRQQQGKPPLSLEQRLEGYRWCAKVGAVMWRTTQDIGPDWNRIMYILDAQEGLEALAGPGAFNDPDMLEVGNGKLTVNENRAHFSLWCMLNAPLFLGNDLRTMPVSVVEIITNKEMIALNQDLMCEQARKVIDAGDIDYFVKPLANGDVAVCVLNRSKQPQEIVIDWAKLGLAKKTFSVRDLWEHKDLGPITNQITRKVGSHDVFVARLAELE